LLLLLLLLRPLQGLFFHTLGIVLLAAGCTMGHALALVIGVRPWWSPQYLIPVLGMVLGNTISGISVGLAAVMEELTTGAWWGQANAEQCQWWAVVAWGVQCGACRLSPLGRYICLLHAHRPRSKMMLYLWCRHPPVGARICRVRSCASSAHACVRVQLDSGLFVVSCVHASIQVNVGSDHK
jgi:hypothetical protein